MSSWHDKLPDDTRQKLTETSMPDWIDPMLATLTDKSFSDEEWIFERKLDGERCIAYKDGDDVRLMSRNEKSLSQTYPELVDAVQKIDVDRGIFDGEVVAFDGNITSFERLQNRIQIKDPEEARQSPVTVYYYLFDVPYLDGYDLSEVGLRHRKAALRNAITFDDPLRFMQHRNADGEAFRKEACSKGWEGLIAKDGRSPYVHSRSRKWLKLKCVEQQEFVIGGYTDPHGERIGFGALLVGYYEDGDLRYAGKVGTGYDDETLKRLHTKLSGLERKTPAFEGEPGEDLPDNEVHWVTPQLVGEFKFTEWTADGKLRHPVYLGLRRDKEPEDVHREVPEA